MLRLIVAVSILGLLLPVAATASRLKRTPSRDAGAVEPGVRGLLRRDGDQRPRERPWL
jgi:hypothetical protein